MPQRRVAVATSGRPAGTDGSDFGHRMVVDRRYTKVAEGKSRLRTLIIAQIVNQVVGSIWFFLVALQDKGLNRFAILSITTGFISLIIGELGRRRSRVNLLRLYSSISSAATAFSVACIVRSDLLVKVIQNQTFSVLTNYELLEAVRVLIGVVLQIFVIITTVSLVQNMSPKRAS